MSWTYFGDPIETVVSLPCIGCGGRTGGVVGRFYPNAACRRRDLGISPDRPMTLAYPCCERCAFRCATDSGFITAVEDIIIDRFRRARARPAPTRAWGSREVTDAEYDRASVGLAD